MPEDDRLLRIEQKVDKLSDAVISIARAEEKLIQLGTLTDVLFKKLEDMNARMMQMESYIGETKSFVNSVNKVMWIFASGLITTAAGILAYTLWG